MTEISLLGCGWLGLPLGRKLVTKKLSVKGSTTSPGKLALLENAGVIPFVIALSEAGIDGNITDFLKSEILIIDIPKKKNDGIFTDKIMALIPYIEASPVKKILLVSSISVYGETSGIVDEETSPQPDSENGRQLLEAENQLLKNPHFKTTVLRFGGLIGDDRHPVKYLSGKENDNPNARVNLIDRDDCIGIITKIIALEKWGETFNAVAPFHPTRQEYYSRRAIEDNLPAPQFTDGGNNGKIVRADKVIGDLKYVFEKPFL
jgi:nucleoside-diphosphate-sugar epimerase